MHDSLRSRRSTSNTDSSPDIVTQRQIDQLISEIETQQQQQQDSFSSAPSTEPVEPEPTFNDETGEAKSIFPRADRPN